MNIQEANEKVQEWINEGDEEATLDLNGLTSAEGLTLPTKVGGDLRLDGLTSAVGLTLPTSVGGDIYLDGLPESDKKALRERHPNLAIYKKISLAAFRLLRYRFHR